MVFFTTLWRCMFTPLEISTLFSSDVQRIQVSELSFCHIDFFAAVALLSLCVCAAVVGATYSSM